MDAIATLTAGERSSARLAESLQRQRSERPSALLAESGRASLAAPRPRAAEHTEPVARWRHPAAGAHGELGRA